ncbi:MAG: 50S ribosome-binding GTPase, partial [Gemmatales bacterium]|nr:50S ribosome-binding GTPase [Gemmatales bacterium]
MLELHCHGGLAVLDWVRDCFVRAGAIPVDPDAWLRLSAKDSPRQLALRMLQQAATLRTASILLEQFHGAWEERVNQLAQAVAEKSAQAMSLAKRLVELIPAGQHLCQPFRVVLAGAPNTGKSTLMNALLGYARAITSPQPGTTRDLVTAEIACDGWPVQLIDTAGWRATEDPLERQGLARAQAFWQQADLVLWLCDRAAAPVLPPCHLPRWIFVANKADLPAQWHLEEISLGTVPSLLVSARTGFGLEDLVHAIVA